MSNKNTPGPWLSATDRLGHPSHVASEIGAVCNFGTAVRRARGIDEIQANSRLIAAAPALLAALQGLLADTQHVAHADCDDGPCPVREARAAVAAALGAA